MKKELSNYEKFEEAIRLIHKFFPESKSNFSKEVGIGIYKFLESVRECNFYLDVSCDPFLIPPEPDLGLGKKGGFNGGIAEVLNRLLDHASFSPLGRCVIIPDVVPESAWHKYPQLPIICDSRKVPERIWELDSAEVFSNASYDSLFVFESGEAMGVDHDLRFFWAKSYANRFALNESY